jgi:DNA polymerase-4
MLSPPRLIAHLDMDAFWRGRVVAIELASMPVVIGGGSRQAERPIRSRAGHAALYAVRDYVGRGVATGNVRGARSA